MRSTDWKTMMELVGVAAIVASLLFVGIQLQQDRELTTVATYGSVTESNNALAELVQNHSDLSVRGLDGKELTDSENAIFFSMIHAVESHYLNFIIRWSAASMGADPEARAQMYASYIYMYPGLRKAIEERDGIYQLRNTAFETFTFGSPLVERALPHLRRLDELRPDIPATKTYVIW
jgi:hypothetical protein